MEYCHFSYSEARDLPIELRRWFIERKQLENEKVEEARKKKGKPPGKPPPPKKR